MRNSRLILEHWVKLLPIFAENVAYLEKACELTCISVDHCEIKRAEILVEGHVCQILHELELMSRELLHYQCRRRTMRHSFGVV